MSKLKVLGVLLVFTIVAIGDLYSADKPVTQVDLIFDASGSMRMKIDGKSRMAIAREAIKSLLAEFAKKNDYHLGLRVYGHLNNRCDNSVLEVPIAANMINQIQNKINSIKPKGKTPIAYSLLQSVKDFDHKKSGKKVIILITDGLENCGGNICEASLKLKKVGIFTSLHVVGIGMKKNELTALNCVAAPFGGKVIGAANAAELVGAFKAISKEVVVDKNLEVSGFDKNGTAVYMDVVISQKGKVVAKSEGTTPHFSLKPGIYNIKAKSRRTNIEMVKSDVRIEQNKKTDVKFVFGESSVKLISLGATNKSIYAYYTVYKNGKSVVSFDGQGERVKTVLPGTYDIKAYEQDTSSTLWIKNVKIQAGEVYKHVFKFKMGKVVIMPRLADKAKAKEYYWYNFYKENKKEKNAPEGVGVKETKLLPGIYNLKVLDGYNKVVGEVKNIKVEADKTVKINVSVPK